MSDAAAAAKIEEDPDELVNYEDEVESGDEAANDATAGADDAGDESKEQKKGHYVGIHSSGFRDFLLKPQLLRAIVDCGFEHPSEVQHECIPNALLGMDVICQAKSGMGKTAVFVLATLQQLNPSDHVSVVVLCNVRELAFQIGHEYTRFSKYLPEVKTAVLYGGVPVVRNEATLKQEKPSVVIATPGRLLDLIRRKSIDLSKVKHFVLDECDKMLEELDMREQVQNIFINTPKDKQVMMFSATMDPTIRPVCRKFMNEPMEIYVDSDAKLTLHGLRQYYIKLAPAEKNRKLNDLLDALEFNQVVIFVSKVVRATELNKLLRECNFPSVVVHGRIKQEERIKRFKDFKEFHNRILVTTDVFARGIDIERVNIVINYDFPGDQHTYLHRVGRAGRFGTKGLAISFVSSEDDAKVLEEVQKKFEVDIPELPESINVTDYMS